MIRAKITFLVIAVLATASREAGAQNRPMYEFLPLGAVGQSQVQPRPGGYFWYNDRCWRRTPSGQYQRVWRRRCL